MNSKAKITGDDVVHALRAEKLSRTAAAVAVKLGTDSRAVATAARGPVADGRISIAWPRKGSGPCHYRFVRLTPRPK